METVPLTDKAGVLRLVVNEADGAVTEEAQSPDPVTLKDPYKLAVPETLSEFAVTALNVETPGLTDRDMADREDNTLPPVTTMEDKEEDPDTDMEDADIAVN